MNSRVRISQVLSVLLISTLPLNVLAGEQVKDSTGARLGSKITASSTSSSGSSSSKPAHCEKNHKSSGKNGAASKSSECK